MQRGNPEGSQTTSVESTEMFITNATPLDGKLKHPVVKCCDCRSVCLWIYNKYQSVFLAFQMLH